MAKNSFIFCMTDGRKVGEAKNLAELRQVVGKVPLESVLYHANRGDFANWLKYLGKPELAAEVRKITGHTGSVRTRLTTTLEPSKMRKLLKEVKKVASGKSTKSSKKKVKKKGKKSK